MTKVAIVGFGFMGKTHCGAWKKASGAKVVAVCDSNLAQLTAKTVGNIKGATDDAQLAKSVKIYDSFDKLLAAGGFDVVDITLPTPLHRDMTVAALKAGYHVICEKPMALSAKDCDKMIAAAKAAKKQLFVGQCVRFAPEYAFLKDAVEDGRFGKVIAADFTRFCPPPGWNNGGKSWFLDEKKSGGAAIDMHVHDTDIVQHLFGLPPAVSTHIHVRKDGLTDHLTTFYHYPNMVVTADTSWAAAGSLVFDAAYRVFFEKATVYCGGAYREPVTVYPASGKPYAPKLAKGTGYEREIRYFNDCLSGKKPAKTVLTATDARNSIAIACAEKKSARLGRAVKVMSLLAFMGLTGFAAPLTGEEIIAKPRAQVPALELPKEGMFFGPATYGWEASMERKAQIGEDDVTLGYSGHTHCRWVAGQPAPSQTIGLTKEYNQGNIIQFWQTGEKLWELSKAAADAGLYAMNIYAPDNPPVAKKLCTLGNRWIGYDTGEIFSFRGDDVKNLDNPTLKDVTDAFMRRVHDHVSQRHQSGWGNVLSTGGDFSMDLQVAAGIDIPLTEDYPMRNQLVSSALERGVARQYGLKLWGTHQAHEWNVFIPYSNPLRQPLLGATFDIKYMTGAKIIINESGNWEVQTTLCEDSPMHELPHVNPCKTITGDKKKIHEAGFDLDAATKEAEKKAHLIGWKSEVSQQYRKICSAFWDFVKENPAPKGQPQATVAVIKGNYDLSGEHNEPAMPIGGAQILADKDGNWYPGAPEDSWELVKDVLAPRPEKILYPSKNFFLSGSPYGLFDITSFAYDNTSAEFLLKNYKAIMFAGWNTCSKKQYRILCDYVKGGGRLVVALPHLSCDATRKYNTFTKDDLVNGGDFSELCGVKVKGQGRRIWWATAAEPDRSKVNCLGIRWPRRYGIMALKVGDLEYTRPADAYEKLAVEDEGGDIPVIFRVKTGKGEVYFVNTWCYPSVANLDEGPGASYGSKGLLSTLYAYVAKISRGDVYIDGVGQDGPDAECDFVVCSYFPEDGRIFLKNIDFREPHRFDLVRNGKRETIVLAPAELRIMR